jgi:hypothetical protein
MRLIQRSVDLVFGWMVAGDRSFTQSLMPGLK